MKIFSNRNLISLFLACSFLLSGCKSTTPQNARPNPDSILDYTDWYHDVGNSGTYNYTKWFELDVWFTENVYSYNWTDITFDVLYEGQVIASDVPIKVDYNYFSCYFDSSFDGAPLTESDYLAPGCYQVRLEDENGNYVLSSECTITVESGDVLSQMIVGKEQIDTTWNQLAFRIDFAGDIRPYSTTGYKIAVSLDGGESSYVPEMSAVEVAESYLIIRYWETDATVEEVIVSVYCGDGSFVCDAELKVCPP